LWLPYEGNAAIFLAIVLLLVAFGFAYAGKHLSMPVAVTRPRGAAAGLLIVIWLLSGYTFFVAYFVYGLQVKLAYPGFVAPRVRVGTFFPDAPVTFFVILYLTRRWGWKVALASAFIGTATAPMIFELPFDLIVMTRVNPPLPTHSILYRQVLFLPLFLWELSSFAVLNGATVDADDGPRRLCGGGDVCDLRDLGGVRFCVPCGTAAARAKHHLEALVLRRSDPAVRLEAGQGSPHFGIAPTPDPPPRVGEGEIVDYSAAAPAAAQSSSCCEVPPPTPTAPTRVPLRSSGTAPCPMIMRPPEAALMPAGVGCAARSCMTPDGRAKPAEATALPWLP
jgi:hypothetical protein